MATTVGMQSVAVPTTVVQVVPEPAHPAAGNKQAFMAVGIIQIIIGVLCIIMGGAGYGIVYAISSLTYTSSGQSFWGGCWFIVSGALAVASGKRPNNCNVIAGLVVAILACLVAFGVGIVEATISSAFGCFGLPNCAIQYTPLIAIHGALSCLAFLEFIIAIVHSAYCCCSGTCCKGAQQGAVIATTSTAYVNAPATQPPMPMQQAYVPPQEPMAQPQPAQNVYTAEPQRDEAPPSYDESEKSPRKK